MNETYRSGLAAILLVLLLVLLATGARRTSFLTSVLDLLPSGDPEVQILRELAEKGQGRQLNVRLFADGGSVDSIAVDAFLKELDKSPYIGSSWIAGNDALEDTGRIIFKHRYEWLLPKWLDQNIPGWRDGVALDETSLARRIADGLDASLQSPEGVALSESIPSDPFLLIGYLYEAGGILPQKPSSGDVYLWVEQVASPFSEDGQEPVFEAFAAAFSKAEILHPGLKMEYSGVSVFASASQAGIKKEIQRMNLLGVLLVFLIAVFSIRKTTAVLRIGGVLLITLIGAATTTILLFSEVHVIALVIGSILVGIAVDYAFHLILTEGRGLPRKVITLAVMAGSASSALGFIFLVWTPLPFLRQVGVFVGSGLICALLTSLLLRPRDNVASLSLKWQIRPFLLPKWSGPVCIMLLLPGIFFLHWRDSISDLEYPLPELKKMDARLRQNSSAMGDYQALLAYGADPLEARRNLEAVIAEKSGRDWLHAGQWISSYEEALEAQRFFQGLPGLRSSLRRELAARDYIPESFESFFADWTDYLDATFTEEAYTLRIRELAASLPGPMENFLHVGPNLSWFLLLTTGSEDHGEMPGVLELDQAGILSRSFSEYRQTVLVFALLCFAVVLLGIVLVYGIQCGATTLAIPGTALLMTFGLSGFIHSGLGLFHLVGGMLAFCIGLDYAIFAVQSHRKGCSMPASVTISLLTTVGVFGILSTSRIPGVHQLGMTVSMGIAATTLLIVAGWPWQGKQRASRKELLNRLPHGREALMVGRILRLEGREIEMECRTDACEDVPTECLVEAMAQAAAVWMAATQQDDTMNRIGLLVLVQRCRVECPVLKAGDRVTTRVQTLSNVNEELLIFNGDCFSEVGDQLLSADFSIFIPVDEET